MEKQKKSKFKRILRYLIIDAIIFAFFLWLLLAKPAGFHQGKPAVNKNVSSYLTNVILPQIYNGAQLQEPFDVIVTEEGINDIIAHSRWPKHSGQASFLMPSVTLLPDGAEIMGVASIKGAEIVVTIAAVPVVDSNGLLNLQISKMKVGNMNVTLIAKMLASKMYHDRLSEVEINPSDIGADSQPLSSTINLLSPSLILPTGKFSLKKSSSHRKKLPSRLLRPVKNN